MRRHWFFTLVYATLKQAASQCVLQRSTKNKNTIKQKTLCSLISWSCPPTFHFRHVSKARRQIEATLCCAGRFHRAPTPLIFANCRLKQKKSPKIKPGGKPVIRAWAKFTGCCQIPGNSYINQRESVRKWPVSSAEFEWQLTYYQMCWGFSFCMNHCAIAAKSTCLQIMP